VGTAELDLAGDYGYAVYVGVMPPRRIRLFVSSANHFSTRLILYFYFVVRFCQNTRELLWTLLRQGTDCGTAFSRQQTGIGKGTGPTGINNVILGPGAVREKIKNFL
jgi:hypothetical protein